MRRCGAPRQGLASLCSAPEPKLLRQRTEQPRWPSSCSSCSRGSPSGAIYALVALGFSLIYNASHVINFAQGEFVMIGGMATVFIAAAGVPLPLAALGAIVLAVAIGLAIERFGVRAGARTPRWSR